MLMFQLFLCALINSVNITSGQAEPFDVYIAIWTVIPLASTLLLIWEVGVLKLKYV